MRPFASASPSIAFLAVVVFLAPAAVASEPPPLPSWIVAESPESFLLRLQCPDSSQEAAFTFCSVEAAEGLDVEAGGVRIGAAGFPRLLRLVDREGASFVLVGDDVCAPLCWPGVPTKAPLPRATYLVEAGAAPVVHVVSPGEGVMNATLFVEAVSAFDASRGVHPLFGIDAPHAIHLDSLGTARIPLRLVYASAAAPEDRIVLRVSTDASEARFPVEAILEPVHVLTLPASKIHVAAPAILHLRAHPSTPPGWLGNVTILAEALPSEWRFGANASHVIRIETPIRVDFEARRADRDLSLVTGEASLVLWVQNRGNAALNVTGHLVRGPEGLEASFTTPRTLPPPRFAGDNLAGSAIEFRVRFDEPPERGSFTVAVEAEGVGVDGSDRILLVVPFVGEDHSPRLRHVDLPRARGIEDALSRAVDAPPPGFLLLLLVGLGLAWRRINLHR